MEEEIKETQGNTEESNPVVKGEDIYVENDPAELERMLGVAPTYDNEEEEEPKEEPAVIDVEIEDPIEETVEIEEVEEEPVDDKEELIEEIEEPVEESGKCVRISDFMDEDTSDFTYLEGNDTDGYHISSHPIEDKAGIKKIVRSSSYIFRHPIFHLRDKVVGYEEKAGNKNIFYMVYFPEYVVSFIVNKEYAKPDSISMKNYLEDLCTRIRPYRLYKADYKESPITITSLRVIEQGIIEVATEDGLKEYVIRNRYANMFYNILAYIRELSDSGMPSMDLKVIPKFFSLCSGKI